MLDYSASFVVLAQEYPLTDIARTLASVAKLRAAAWRDPKSVQVLCGCSDERHEEVDAVLKEHGAALCREVGPHMPPLPFTPDVAAWMNTAARNIYGECVVLVAPGRGVDESSGGTLAAAVRSVGKDRNLLLLSEETDSVRRLPVRAIFSSVALRTRGILLTASDGMDVSRHKPFFGRAKYRRTGDRVRDPDTPWLIGTIAYEYQVDRARLGLRLEYTRI